MGFELNENSRYNIVVESEYDGFFIEKRLPFPWGSILTLEWSLTERSSPSGKIINNYEGRTKVTLARGQFIDLVKKKGQKLRATEKTGK
jgi:hypothetical protein